MSEAQPKEGQSSQQSSVTVIPPQALKKNSQCYPEAPTLSLRLSFTVIQMTVGMLCLLLQ